MRFCSFKIKHQFIRDVVGGREEAESVRVAGRAAGSRARPKRAEGWARGSSCVSDPDYRTWTKSRFKPFTHGTCPNCTGDSRTNISDWHHIDRTCICHSFRRHTTNLGAKSITSRGDLEKNTVLGRSEHTDREWPYRQCLTVSLQLLQQERRRRRAV